MNEIIFQAEDKSFRCSTLLGETICLADEGDFSLVKLVYNSSDVMWNGQSYLAIEWAVRDLGLVKKLML